MSDYITTYTGKHFYPTSPDPELIDVRDIAHALSLICRGNGQVKTFYSVGQHCIQCVKEAQARGLSNRMVLACLLHDAGECYLSDVPRPFKKTLNGYKKLEDQILNMIYVRYLGTTLSEEEENQLKEIDDTLLWYDLDYLLHEVQYGKAPTLYAELNYDIRTFESVEKEYLEIFYTFRNLI